jgi:hypothetical protein
MRFLGASLMALAAVLVLAGCEQGSDTAGESGVTVEPPEPGVSSEDTGIMAKGGARQFTAVGFNGELTWSVTGTLEEGEDTKSEDTAISDTGLLTVAKDETNITLTVRAASAETPDEEGGDPPVEVAVTVKVKGWEEVKDINTIFGTASVSGVAYGAGKWVAAGGTSGVTGKEFRLAYSDDGESWREAIPTPAVSKAKNVNKPLNNVVYDGPEGGKIFIAVGKTKIIIYSINGEDWQDATVSNTVTDFESYGAVYGNGMFIAPGYAASGTKFAAAVSYDGITWTLTEPDDTTIQALYSSSNKSFAIAYGAGKFVVPFGQYAAIATTTNGADMTLAANTAITMPAVPAKGYADNYFSSSQRRALFAGSQWIVGGHEDDIGKLVFSADAASWSTAGATGLISIMSIGYGAGKLAIGDSNGNFAFTSLPVSAESQWTKIALHTETPWETNIGGKYASVNAICYGNNKFIVAGGRGRMAIAHEETISN